MRLAGLVLVSGIENGFLASMCPKCVSGIFSASWHLFRPPGRARHLASHSVILARQEPRPVKAHSPTTTTTNEPGTYLRREPLVAGLAAGAVSGVAAER